MKTQATLGWMGPDTEEILVTNRSGATRAVGDVLQLDAARADAASTNNTVGSENAGLANGVLPATAQIQYGIFGVVMRAATDDSRTVLRLRGAVNSVLLDAATAVGLGLIPINGAVDLADSAGGNAGEKIIGILLTATAGAGLSDAWFDGINGFGSSNDQV